MWNYSAIWHLPLMITDFQAERKSSPSTILLSGSNSSGGALQRKVSQELRVTERQVRHCPHQQGHCPSLSEQGEQSRSNNSSHHHPRTWMTRETCSDVEEPRSSQEDVSKARSASAGNKAGHKLTYLRQGRRTRA